MNLIATSPLWLLALVGAALAAAAIEDAVRLRISNATSLAVLLAGGTLMFASGKVGGGDVKLLACLGLWVNLAAAVWLLVTVAIAGGILALGFIIVRSLSGRKARKSLAGRDRGIPYGLAIVAGACIVFAGQLGWLQSQQQKADPFSVKVPG